MDKQQAIQQRQEVKEEAEKVLNLKHQISLLKAELDYTEHKLVKTMVNMDPDMLTINWSRVCRVYNLEPVVYRMRRDKV